MDATEDAFRALARSSPWRFTTLHFTHRRVAGHPPDGPVEAWLKRPGRLSVLDAQGRRHVETGVPYSSTVLAAWEPGLRGLVDRLRYRGLRGRLRYRGRPGVPRRYRDDPRPPRRTSSYTEVPDGSPRPPQSVQPDLRPDGLVAARPDDGKVDYDDPMHRDYVWVAMLDPAELSEGVAVSDVREVVHHGRTGWRARLRAVEGYDPRCSCCPLLFGEQSERQEREAGSTLAGADPAVSYPEAFDVVLDVQTGIVVSLVPLGGSRDDLGFDNRIHAVDASVPDELFERRHAMP